jgi:putative membrane protein
MQDLLLEHYNWLRALHVIAVISWMAGLLYLPRLFVYHVSAIKGGELSETLKIMERRLLKFIMTPASIATWLFGGLMLYANPALFQEPWIHVKLLCVVLLTGAHHSMSAYTKKFARDANTKGEKFYRILNEVPTILMIVIVLLVLVRPF